MSTALVSHFCDMGDVLYQPGPRRLRSGSSSSIPLSGFHSPHPHQQQAVPGVGMPIPIQQRPQQQQHGGYMAPASRKHSRTESPTPHQHVEVLSKFPSPPSSPQMVPQPIQGSPILGQRGQEAAEGGVMSSPGSKIRLQRSVSEPVPMAVDNRRVSFGMNSPTGSGSSLNSQQVQPGPGSSRYKTELCRPFEESGYCKYGDKCQFAHGMQELRSLARHPKYKTELCRTFHTIGFCPYGPRCHFIHNEDERKLNQINHMKQVPSPQTSPGSPQRPQRLDVSLNMSMVRDSLGSTADSPPSSFTDSPTLSPTYLNDDLLAFMNATSQPIQISAKPPPPQVSTSVPAAASAFLFQELAAASMLAPLNVHTDPLSNLAAGLKATTLNTPADIMAAHHSAQEELNGGDMVFNTPPSPPDSLSGDSIIGSCGSPIDLGRGLRLPIFSRISHD